MEAEAEPFSECNSPNILQFDPAVNEPLKTAACEFWATDQADSAPLFRCESVLATERPSFFEAGKALAEIQEKKLFREKFESFGAYCRVRWGINRFQADRQIQAARIMKHLLELGGIPLPKNERQVRPLRGLSREKAQKAWQHAIQSSGAGKTTERHVREAVQQLKGGTRASASAPELWQDLIKPVLRKALAAATAGERETLIDHLNKAALLAEIGRTQKSTD